MEKKRSDYIAPFTEVTRVEVESAICSGSVQFGDGKEKFIVINDQSFNTGTENDFSDQAWDMGANTTNP